MPWMIRWWESGALIPSRSKKNRDVMRIMMEMADEWREGVHQDQQDTAIHQALEANTMSISTQRVNKHRGRNISDQIHSKPYGRSSRNKRNRRRGRKCW